MTVTPSRALKAKGICSPPHTHQAAGKDQAAALSSPGGPARSPATQVSARVLPALGTGKAVHSEGRVGSQQQGAESGLGRLVERLETELKGRRSKGEAGLWAGRG